jgi:hypothetical protein
MVRTAMVSVDKGDIVIKYFNQSVFHASIEELPSIMWFLEERVFLLQGLYCITTIVLINFED